LAVSPLFRPTERLPMAGPFFFPAGISSAAGDPNLHNEQSGIRRAVSRIPDWKTQPNE
jgi:hypothetical protein